MDIASLKTLLTLAEYGSFSKAAEQLHITQPAVSKRIAALENELGCPLFDRIGKQALLTEAGHSFASSARQILHTLEDGKRAIANLSKQISGILRLATSHHIGLHRLPQILRTYSTCFPQVQLDLHFLDSEQGCHAVEQGKIELAVVTLPQKPSSFLTLEKIWDDPLIPLSNQQHPLSEKNHLELRQLANFPAILPAKGTFTRCIIEQVFAEHALTLKIALETNYLETIKMLVSIGLGWSILPASMLDTSIHALNVKNLHLHRELGIVRHRERSLSNAASALIEMLRKS